MNISTRVSEMQFSPIRRFNKYAFEAEAAGKKVYKLNIGQPDVETPECFMDAVRDFHKSVIAYAESGGNTELLEAIIKYNSRYGINLTKDNILVTNGGSEALIMAFTTILNAGDEAIIAEPFYTNYRTFCNQVSGKLVPITAKAENGYHWADRELIESAITDRTKAICCISPGNPTGRVLTMEEMKLIGEIATEHDLWIIADEVYREFVFDGEEVTSFGMLEELADRVIIVDSVSKRFSACGARVGCVISKNEAFMEGVLKLAQGRLCCPTLEQIGAAALYSIEGDYYDMVKAEYEARRDAAYEELSKIPQVICHKPKGAFYMTVKLPVENVEDFLMFLLTEFDDKGETVMFAPAEGFYMTPGMGRDEMRIAYVLAPENMRRGAELIRLGLASYNEKEKSK